MCKFFYKVVNPFIAIFLVLFVGVGFALSLVTSLSIESWTAIFIITFLICAIFFVVKKPNFALEIDLGTPSKFSRLDRLIGYLPYLVFIPGFLVLLSNNYFQMLFDARIHINYINQIFVGISPPENPYLPGYPPNYYWLFHALLATLSQLTQLASPLLATLLNIVVLIAVIGWIRQTIRAMGYGNQHPLYLTLFVIFAIFGLNIFGIIHAADNIFANGIMRDDRYDMLFLIGETRLRSLWFKFLTFTSFPLTLVYYTMGIFASVQLVKGNIQASTIILLLFAIAGGIAFNLGTGMFTLAIMLPAIIGALILYELLTLRSARLKYLLPRLRLASKVIQANIAKIDVLLIGILSLAMFFLIRKYYVGATDSYQVTGNFQLGNVFNLRRLIGVFYPLIPFFVVSLIYGFKTRNRITLFTGLGAIGGCLIAYVSVLRGDNQYKFIHLTSFLICLTIVPLIDYLIHRVQHLTYRRLGRLIVAILLGLAVLNVGYVSMTRIQWGIDLNQGLFEHDDVTYNGPNFVSAKEPYQDIYEWLRESTPTRTVVVMPAEDSDRLVMVSERLPYAGNEVFSFVRDVVEYDERLDRLNTFFAAETSVNKRKELIIEFLQLDAVRPIVLLIPDEVIIPDDQLIELNLQLLFEGKNGSIFALRI